MSRRRGRGGDRLARVWRGQPDGARRIGNVGLHRRSGDQLSVSVKFETGIETVSFASTVFEEIVAK
mgnify:CR=1 FL=1